MYRFTHRVPHSTIADTTGVVSSTLLPLRYKVMTSLCGLLVGNSAPGDGEHWEIGGGSIGGPGPLWLLQCGCPPSGSDPSLPAPTFFGPSSGPPSTAGDTLPLAPSPCCSLAAITCRDRSRVPPVPPDEAFEDVVGDKLSPPGVGIRSSLPGQPRGSPFGTWAVVGSVGGAVSGSHLSDSFLASTDLIVN